MKKLLKRKKRVNPRFLKFLILAGLLLNVPGWAADELKPEPLEQAIKEYNAMVKSDDVDSGNHEVWKLYCHGVLIQSGSGRRVSDVLAFGLLPDSADRYRVFIQVNALYNYLRPLPKRDSVVVVEGRVIRKLHGEVKFHDSNAVVKTEYLLMYPENAIILPKEHFDPLAATPIAPISPLSPTPTPGRPRR